MGNYIDDVFLYSQGYANAILASLKYLNEQVNSKILAETEQAPLLEVSLELVVPDVQWSPEIGESGDPERPGVRDLINGWVRAFQNTGTLVRRLDICEGNYIGELCDIECGCSGHGTQTAIDAARTAGSCAAGSCTCEGNYAGEFCQHDCCGQLEHRNRTRIEAGEDGRGAVRSPAADVPK